MNETSARRAIKSLISTNSDLLVTDLTFQGNPKTIHQITTSSVTPPTGYYFISITVTSSDSRNKRGFGKTVSVPPSEAKYEISIEVADYIIGYPSEEELFEKMDSDFQLFTDRIVALIRKSYEIADSTTGTTFVLNSERNVIKNNTGTSWDEASQYHAMLYCQISFQLIESCTDDSNLYPVEEE